MKKMRKRYLVSLLILLMSLLMVTPAAAASKPTIKLNRTSAQMYPKGSMTLKATVTGKKGTVKWNSSDSKVASVNSSGKVVAKKKGTAVITASVGSLKAKCTVKVKAVNYKKLYYDFLKKSEKSFTVPGGDPAWKQEALSFYLLNLDNDSVPELIINTVPRGGTTYHVYTIKNNKVVYCGMQSQNGSSHTIIYNPKEKALYTYSWINRVGATVSNLYGLSGTKLVQQKYCYCEDSYKNCKVKYSASGSVKNVSKSVYESFYKKYFEPKDRKEYTMHFNTEQVRKKILG